MTDDLDFTDKIIHECAACERGCFDPSRCEVCDDRPLLCVDCRKACPECDTVVCYDHWDEKRKTCKPCEEARRISSGIARAEWERYGYDD